MKTLNIAILIGLLISSCNSFADLNTGLVAYYPFSGNIKDTSNNGNHGSNYGANLSVDRFGNANSSYTFNGRSSYIEIPSSQSLNMTGSLSIGFWMKPFAWQDGLSAGIVSKKASDSSNGYVIYNDGFFPKQLNFRMRGTQTNTSNMSYYNAPNAYYMPSSSNVDLNTWQHWTATYDSISKTARLYKNGVLTLEYIGLNIGDMTSTTPLHIGHSQTWNGFFNGQIDDVSIYNRALSSTEVQQLYQTGVSSQYRYIMVSTLQDINNDQQLDQALLSSKDGLYYLQIISGIDGKKLNQITLATNLVPVSLTAMNTQVTVLSKKIDNTNILQQYDATTGNLIGTINLTK